jgi:hypothetical protein
MKLEAVSFPGQGDLKRGGKEAKDKWEGSKPLPKALQEGGLKLLGYRSRIDCTRTLRIEYSSIKASAHLQRYTFS